MRNLLFALVLSISSLAALAQTKPMVKDIGADLPTSAAYIGNSFFYYNNGINGHMGQLVSADKSGQRSRNVMITIGGSGFDWHDVESYFRPNAVSRYSFDANNNVVFNKLDKLFDVAVMKDIFTEYAKKNSDIVRKFGTKPVFFMSWAYQDKSEMTAQLAEAYTKAGNDNGALVIPAGLAFARSIAQKPDLSLYVADKRHPTLAGTYLAACTTYATLYKRSPVGNTYTAGLDVVTAAHLQKVAWETVQDYFKP
jgi:hypothetical protein